MNNCMALILAAGKGTRMKSDLPKVLHELNGKPVLEYVLNIVEGLGISYRVIVTGFRHDLVEEVVGERGYCVHQKEQLGTGHAVLQAWNYFFDYSGNVLVLYGDTPLFRAELIKNFLEYFQNTGSHITVLTTMLEDPGQYGRIVREGEKISAIVEYKDATSEEKNIKEINTGTCCFKAEVLKRFLPLLKNDNEQGELYLTDVIKLSVEAGLNVRAYCTEDWEQTLGINTLDELDFAAEILKKRGKLVS